MISFTKLEKAILGVTSSVALLLGLFTIFSLISDPVNNLLVKEELSLRNPASELPIEKTENQVKFLDRTMVTLDMKCLEEKQVLHFTSAARMIQIRGQICQSSELNELEIINRTNGTKASIFNLKNQNFMTDYLSMAPGKNQVLIKLTKAEGESYLNELYFDSQIPMTE